MTRVVLGEPCRRNCDVAIATIEPLLDQQVSFQSIRKLPDDFLRNRRRVGFDSIQPCPYGQAYVHFNFIYDRDFLISGIPHEYGNYIISFAEHNKGWNNKTITMKCEVWLMLFGYNINIWSRVDIEKTVAAFGKLLVLEEDLIIWPELLLKREWLISLKSHGSLYALKGKISKGIPRLLSVKFYST